MGLLPAGPSTAYPQANTRILYAAMPPVDKGQGSCPGLVWKHRGKSEENPRARFVARNATILHSDFAEDTALCAPMWRTGVETQTLLCGTRVENAPATLRRLSMHRSVYAARCPRPHNQQAAWRSFTGGGHPCCSTPPLPCHYAAQALSQGDQSSGGFPAVGPTPNRWAAPLYTRGTARRPPTCEPIPAPVESIPADVDNTRETQVKSV